MFVRAAGVPLPAADELPVIAAQAGIPAANRVQLHETDCHPRASGDPVVQSSLNALPFLSSPRRRTLNVRTPA